MNRRLWCAISLTLLLSELHLFADDLKPIGTSEAVTPGSVLTVPAPADVSPTVTMHPVSDPAKSIIVPGTTATNGISVTLPTTLAAGQYYFVLSDNRVVPGAIEVAPDKVAITAVSPTTAYHLNKDSYDFRITGDNFSRDPANDHVLVDNVDIVSNRASDEEHCKDKPNCLVVNDDHQMEVLNYKPAPHQGVVNVGVRVGSRTTSSTKELVLAKVSRAFVFVLSGAVTSLLFWIVTITVRSGLASKQMGRRRGLSLLEIFIFDPETNSYSLSKFQLLLFSVTFIFSYLYVLLTGWLVQWQFALPEVPDKIAGLLAISGGTTIASAGLTAARGSKGAGLQQPSGADMISSGGVVIPERFQFFVWTIVACGGFVALLVGQDPATVTSFPTIPDGLMYLMGVSAAGYLGGKAARKPGPSLELIGVEKKTNSDPRYVLTVQGRNLDSEGRFFVDGQELGILSDEEKSKLGLKPTDKLIETTPQPGASDTNFCKQLKITVPASKINLEQGNHNFRIVNRDGQFADLLFSQNAPNITAVYQEGQDAGSKPLRVPASKDSITVIIEGTNLGEGCTVSWRGENDANPSQYTPKLQDGKLRVDMITGVAGTGILSVTTAEGYVVSKTIAVGDKGAPLPKAGDATVASNPAPADTGGGGSQEKPADQVRGGGKQEPVP